MDDLNELENSFSLNLVIRKSHEDKTDENGNYIFEVEASNEALDLQGQVVLQRALLDSKDHFLKNGIVSFDHLHKRRGADGEVISDPSMVIGEPVSIRTEGTRTFVKGKLYGNKKITQDIIELLKAGSTRVRASVGGILPKIVRDAKTGIEKITSVLWNDLALTVSPVNATVSAAYFAKSYDPAEFVKALTAGHGTNSAEHEGGRALIPEDVAKPTQEVSETNAGYEELKDKIRSLIAAMNNGEIKDKNHAIKYLINQGLDIEQARAVVREISFAGGQI
ncbi:MAG: hypothetical protein LBB72_01530 [Spirochaetaceae bacterium]|jgi:hypothetical protein|nr:hypothetical protein [Spirochaetaceae bacterium]